MLQVQLPEDNTDKMFQYKEYLDSNHYAKKVLFTHTDLDGAGCEVLFRRCMKIWEYHEDEDFEIYRVDYGWDETLEYKHILEAAEEVWITDISVSDETAKMLNDRFMNKDKYFELRLFDHHQSAYDRLKDYEWCWFDLNMCGTALFYKWLAFYNGNCINYYDHSDKYSILDYKPFVKLVNDYDMWLYPFGEALKLHTLNILNRNKFVEKFTNNPNIEYTDDEKKLIENEMNEFENTLNILKNYNIYPINTSPLNFDGYYIGEFAFMKIDDDLPYSSLAMSKILSTDYPNIQFYALYNKKRHKVSLRQNLNSNRIIGIASGCGGGGHRKACGFNVPENMDADDVIKAIQTGRMD